MTRSSKFASTVVASLVLALVAAVLTPSTAMAKPPVPKKPIPVKFPGPHPHYYGGFGLYVGGPRYVVDQTVVVPTVDVANRASYTLMFKDKDGQTRVYGEFIATVSGGAVTDWGGLIEARDALTKAGVECWITGGRWLTTASE